MVEFRIRRSASTGRIASAPRRNRDYGNGGDWPHREGLDGRERPDRSSGRASGFPGSRSTARPSRLRRSPTRRPRVRSAFPRGQDPRCLTGFASARAGPSAGSRAMAAEPIPILAGGARRPMLPSERYHKRSVVPSRSVTLSAPATTCPAQAFACLTRLSRHLGHQLPRHREGPQQRQAPTPSLPLSGASSGADRAASAGLATCAFAHKRAPDRAPIRRFRSTGLRRQRRILACRLASPGFGEQEGCALPVSPGSEGLHVGSGGAHALVACETLVGGWLPRICTGSSTDTFFRPSGHSDTGISVKFARPSGIPMIVMHWQIGVSR